MATPKTTKSVTVNGLTVRKVQRFGWIPDLPDQRDYLYAAPAPFHGAIPAKMDLSGHCPPVYDQGQLGSCHDAQTDVLSDRGWKRFADLDGSERLATVDPSTAALHFEAPVRIVRFPFDGELVCGRGDNIDFRVTPDHQMLVRKWDERARTLASGFTLVDAKDIGWYAGLLNRVTWSGESSSASYTLPGVDHKHIPQRSPRDVPMAAWMRFLGVYIARGTMLKRDQRAGHVSYKIQLAASKEREKAFIRDVLSELGLIGLELADRFTFSNRQVYEAMASLGLEGLKAGFKRVPAFIFRQSAAMIREFLAGHFAGDGCDQRGLRAHDTSSAGLADDLQLLAFLSGSESRISVRAARTSMMADGRTVVGSLPEHQVSICERKNLSIERQKQISRQRYVGEVFCAEVPTFHTLVTRRNGKILVSGNCTANAIAAAIEFDQIKAQQPEFTPSRLFIYYNERTIEGTVKNDAGAQIRDGIKSVATLGAAPEKEWPYVLNKFSTKPPVKVYADAKKHVVQLYQRLVQELSTLKGCLASGYPFVFGFTCYDSFEGAAVAKTGVLGMPASGEKMVGGHAVLCVGYDDKSRTFLVRNSWGPDWGRKGYFTIPYSYLTDHRLASDLWTIRSTK